MRAYTCGNCADANCSVRRMPSHLAWVLTCVLLHLLPPVPSPDLSPLQLKTSRSARLAATGAALEDDYNNPLLFSCLTTSALALSCATHSCVNTCVAQAQHVRILPPAAAGNRALADNNLLELLLLDSVGGARHLPLQHLVLNLRGIKARLTVTGGAGGAQEGRKLAEALRCAIQETAACAVVHQRCAFKVGHCVEPLAPFPYHDVTGEFSTASSLALPRPRRRLVSR